MGLSGRRDTDGGDIGFLGSGGLLLRPTTGGEYGRGGTAIGVFSSVVLASFDSEVWLFLCQVWVGESDISLAVFSLSG